MDELRKVLASEGVSIEDGELQGYLSELGVSESDLSPDFCSQIASDLKTKQSQNSKLAKPGGDRKLSKRNSSRQKPSNEPRILDRAVREHATSLQQYIQEVDGAILQLNNAAVHFLGDKIESHFESFDQQVQSRVQQAIADRPRLNRADIDQMVADTMPPEFMDYWKAG